MLFDDGSTLVPDLWVGRGHARDWGLSGCGWITIGAIGALCNICRRWGDGGGALDWTDGVLL